MQPMIKQAVILAGGQGSRLRPVTLEIPKPLVPVQGVPIATWLVRWFARHGIERIVVIYPTRWKAAFESWKQSTITNGVSIELFEEAEAMGTMGALVHSLTLGTDPIFVTNGDELKGLDLTMLESSHTRLVRDGHAPAVSIALVRVPNPSEYGVAEMDDHRIVRFHEKPAIPPTTLISSGLYLIDPSVFSEVDRSEKFLMFEKHLFPRLAQEGRLAGCELDGQWYDCGTMERWERAIQEWRG